MVRKIEVRMPLFDRLVDLQPEVHVEVRPLRTLDRTALLESVRRELEQLLNTRCPFPSHRLTERDRSVIDYGIPDFRLLSPHSHDDRKSLAASIRESIAAFEPRLRDVRVFLEPIAGNERSLAGVIEADLLFEGVAEPVAFQTLMQRDATVEVVLANAE